MGQVQFFFPLGKLDYEQVIIREATASEFSLSQVGLWWGRAVVVTLKSTLLKGLCSEVRRPQQITNAAELDAEWERWVVRGLLRKGVPVGATERLQGKEPATCVVPALFSDFR